MVRTSTRQRGHSRPSRSIILMLLPPGIVRSRVITSGASSPARDRASRLFAASPTTSMSGWALIIVRRPARTTEWSSTTRIRILAIALLAQWDARDDPGAAARRRFDRQGPAQEGGPLAHAGQPELPAGARVAGVEAAAVVLDAHPHRRRPPLDDDAGGRGPRVLRGV